MEQTLIPEVGKVYAFYDDGKIGYSRQYLAMVTRVIPIDSAEVKRQLAGMPINDDNVINKQEFYHSIEEYWKDAVKVINWIFAKTTDYIVECAIPIYDEHLIYFARTQRGTWFSFEIQTDWQCGYLDVEGRNDEYLAPELKEKRNNNKI